jgi:hypothetical protein
MPALTFKGNPTAAVAAPVDMTAIQSMDTIGWRVFSVRNYGATGNGSTDDTAAINAAIAAIVTAGRGCLYFPVGIYNCTTLSAIPDFTYVLGAGRAASLIRTTVATGTLLTVTGQYVKFQDIQITTSVTRTANPLLDVQTTANYFQMMSCTMSGGFVNLQINSNSPDISYCNFLEAVAATGTNILINGGLDMAFSHCVLTNAGGQPAFGIQVTNAGDIGLTDVQSLRQGTCLALVPGAGQTIASLTSINSGFDNNSTRGVFISPSSTGAVVRTRFIGSWFGASGNQGLFAQAGGSGTIDGLDIIDCHVYGNGADGMFFSTGVKNVRIIGGEFAGNSLSGIHFTDCTDFTVQGVKSGTNGGGFGVNARYGLEITGATCDLFTVANNDFRGNTLGPWLNGSTVTGSTWSLYNNLGAGGDPIVKPTRFFLDGFNGTVANRYTFQSFPTGNNFTSVQVAPAGTSVLSTVACFNNSDLTAAAGFVDLRLNAAIGRVGTDQINGGTVPDMSIFAGGTRMQWSASTGRARMGPALAADDGITDVQVNSTLRAASVRTQTQVISTATYTVSAQDHIVLISAAANNVVVTLPLANAAGGFTTQSLRFKRVDASANTVTVQRQGTNTIDGATSFTLASLASKDLESDGSGTWYIF